MNYVALLAVQAELKLGEKLQLGLIHHLGILHLIMTTFHTFFIIGNVRTML